MRGKRWLLTPFFISDRKLGLWKAAFKNYTAFCEEIKHATEKTIVQMLDVE
jgi:hypothetical protein